MRVFAIIGGLILMVLIGALVIPLFINWSDYKGRFETAAAELTGMPVTVGGDADVRLLPFPSLTFGDVRIGAPDSPTAVIERFSVDAELAPFLTGELHIFDMRLDRPVFFSDPAGAAVSASETNAAGELTNIIQDIRLEQATITDGSILVRDISGGDAWRVSGLNGVLAADSREGPFRFSGDGVINGVPVQGQFSTGRLSEDGFSLTTRSTWRNRGISIGTQGRVLQAGATAESAFADQLHYDGTFQVSPLSDFANKDATPFMIEGVFVAAEDALVIDQYRASFGAGEDPYTVDGEFSLQGGDQPTYGLSARGTQLNWTGLSNNGNGERDGGFETLLTDMRAVFEQLPLPTIAGTLSIDLPAIIYGETTIRDVRLEADPAAQNDDGSARWQISRIEAKLPGRTQLEASGEVTLPRIGDETQPLSFDGQMVLASRQPSGLATWLGLPQGLGISRLQRAGAQARFTLTPEAQRFDDLELILDGNALGGRLERSQVGDRTLLQVALDGAGVSDVTFNTFDDVVASFGVDQGSTDVDLSVDFTDVSRGGLSADRLQARLRARPEQWSVDQLQMDGFFGASVAATAVLRSNDSARDVDYDISIVSVDGAPLIAGLDAIVDVPASIFEDYVARALAHDADAFADMNVTLKGVLRHAMGTDEKTFETAISGAAGGTNIVGNAQFDGALARWPEAMVAVDVSASNPVGGSLAAQLGFHLDDANGGELTTRLTGTPHTGLDTTISAKLTGVNGRFDGSVMTQQEAGGRKFSVEGAVTADGDEFWRGIAALGVPIVVDEISGFELAAQISATNDAGVTVRDLDAQIGTNMVGGELRLSATDEVFVAQGNMTFGTVDLTPLWQSFAGLPSSYERETVFARSGLDGYEMDIAVTTDRLIVPGTDLPLERARFQLEQNGVQLGLSGFSASIFDGDLTGRLELQNLDGTLLAEGQWDLRDAGSALLALDAPAASGRFDVTGSGTMNGYTVATLLESLTGSGTVSANGFALSGIDSAGMPDMIAAVDAVGFGIDDDQVAALVDDHLLNGETVFAPMQSPLSITSGVGRLSNVVLQSEDGLMEGLGSVQLDVASNELTASASFDFGLADADQLGVTPGLALNWNGQSEAVNTGAMETFVIQRSIDREQKRIAALHARLGERQRLRIAVRQANYQRDRRLAAEQAVRLEQERLAAEAAEEARLALELEEERQRERQRVQAEQQEAERQRVIRQRQQVPVDPFRQEVERESLPPAVSSDDGIFDNLEFEN